ncbi:putative sensor histidine kinase (dctS) [Cupriavidus taiwanensis]|uniref:histidine kinase n=1 Tax=Cupriavidus taiwanensis TaxID=164546 RepID=A0A976AU73_9BURK|nr:sensor histidine kinase [Cupriavidus taiwanensis]SOZ51037.1 putative sensor histidine kinase (dctS) [Cupriavidus taiwanensis]SOZ52620.1 putative sensor histidine kinase (dctS) [Cupriavidus taiwanensis]SOZ54848.1 putative sensor histidine kinase (dctS) [Cupriavidus taiwanensis]SPA04401.1 putative sensor histidine kinase (dctS) [Cupriavidus taiwanensis]SPA15094.1 putative sensor histidine kinase (dctS) [Cupriavidus taiwanensis]
MRLADFILRDMSRILTEWEAFAATLMPAARHMDSLALRDHAVQILQAVAKDLSTPQTSRAQREKSMGRAPRLADAPETAAQTHALLRARHGFNINQMVAEYRALRASVLRLWIDACLPDAPDLDDMIRFNEAIDQAVAESVGYFDAQVEQARNLLLGMLGHDMRSPLQTIQSTAHFLVALNAGEKVSEAAARLIRSGARMNALLDDLCDFNRTKLGLGINIVPAGIDLAQVFGDTVDQLRAAHPDHGIELAVHGNVRGVWDGLRLQQLLSNLVTNAVMYGAADAPVRVVVTGDDAEVRVAVWNSGPPIDPQTLGQIFDPLRRGEDPHDKNAPGLGLGLYIASEIAKAHRGSIEARSDAAGTVFEVRLPHQA